MKTPEFDRAYAECLDDAGQITRLEPLYNLVRKLECERDDLREIFPRILEALESGACASTCSVDFLREIPREVRLVRQQLERERDEARRDSIAYKLAVELNEKYLNDLRTERDQLRKVVDNWSRAADAWGCSTPLDLIHKINNLPDIY